MKTYKLYNVDNELVREITAEKNSQAREKILDSVDIHRTAYVKVNDKEYTVSEIYSKW